MIITERLTLVKEAVVGPGPNYPAAKCFCVELQLLQKDVCVWACVEWKNVVVEAIHMCAEDIYHCAWLRRQNSCSLLSPPLTVLHSIPDPDGTLDTFPDNYCHHFNNAQL